MTETIQEPEARQCWGLAVQVCVPTDWSDDQVLAFAESEYPCGTTHGWAIRKEGHERLSGDPERNPCANPVRRGFVHIMLEA